MVPGCSYSYESYSQAPREAHIMRIARNLQITLNQFSAQVLSLSTPRFQDPQKTSNCASNGVCAPSQLPETVGITKSASTSFVGFIDKKSQKLGRGALTDSLTHSLHCVLRFRHCRCLVFFPLHLLLWGNSFALHMILKHAHYIHVISMLRRHYGIISLLVLV